MNKNINLLTIATVFLMSFTVYVQVRADVLRDYCDKTGGVMLMQWTCPNTKNLRRENFCKEINSQGKELVFNGCTATIGNSGELFFKACVIHDLCYHNEPGATGRTKADCDDSFLNNMNQICDQTKSKASCYSAAQTFYYAVTIGGSASWSCSKEDAHYPSKLEELP